MDKYDVIAKIDELVGYAINNFSESEVTDVVDSLRNLVFVYED